jgi:hypothetical protein
MIIIDTTDPLGATQALWSVTVSNGSGTAAVEVAGTQASAWAWAAAAADHGAFGPGAWAPVDIKIAGGVATDGPATPAAFGGVA